MLFRRTAFAAAVTAVTLLGAVPALAHVGDHPTSGFLAGITHPLFGPDHLLAMIAVGLYAALLGGRALWLVPAAFVGAMALAGIVGTTGMEMPLVEPLIIGSVLVIGALVAFGVRLPVALGMAVVGLFALAHGYAHGAEMPVGSSGLLYGLGFVLATSFLHLVGVGIGSIAGRVGGLSIARLGGGAVLAAGLVLLIAG